MSFMLDYIKIGQIQFNQKILYFETTAKQCHLACFSVAKSFSCQNNDGHAFTYNIQLKLLRKDLIANIFKIITFLKLF